MEIPSHLIETDKLYLHNNVPMSNAINHQKWKQMLYSNFNKKGLRILEIGSREVCGKSNDRQMFSEAEYVGFDIYTGNNVDVVGDAHKLSSYFKPKEQFDLIYSSAVFEHFAMPWLVAVEIAKMLKIGGHVMIETHYAFGSHERPWHFFQFSEMALKVLFSKSFGFECIEAGVSNPIVGRFSTYADEYLRYKPVGGLYCHSEYFGRKIREVETYDWNNIDLNDVVGGTNYPEPMEK